MVFKWYIKASIHVSLCLLAMVWFTGLIFEVEVSGDYILALLFGSISGYNIIKYGFDPGTTRMWASGGGKILILLSLLSLLLAGYFFIHLALQTRVLLIIAVLITALYTFPLRPGGVNLRSYGILKVFLVALVWTILSVWAPVWSKTHNFSWDMGVESLQRMIWVFLLMIPFEIRDMHADPPEMRSIPQRFGLRNTYRITWVAATLFALATFFKDAPAKGEFACKIAIAFLMALSIVRASDKQPSYYASFWVEGIPLAALGLLLLFQL